MPGLIRQGWWFVRGLRRYLGEPITLDDARRTVREGVGRRGARLADNLDLLVWSVPDSPYLALLRHAGFERRDVTTMIESNGVEATLAALRDAGVYVSYEEYLGREVLQRGSLRLDLSPARFLNPRERADLFGSTSGTRSGGISIAVSFQEKRFNAMRIALAKAMHDVLESPSSVWLPALPSAAGFSNVINLAGAGQPAERWFSQVSPRARAAPARKRILNHALPLLGRLVGVRLAAPRHVPAIAPQPVLDWCVDALARSGSAYLVSFPSSAVRLATLAREQDRDLTGLVIDVVGEPVTQAKASAIRAPGAKAGGWYSFVQNGPAATSCPWSEVGSYHVHDQDLAVITRKRERSDGVEVDALLFTVLRASARTVMLNLENDDYGTVSADGAPCPCELGILGLRTRLSDIRGMSKVVAGGVTVRGDVLEDLVDHVLPARVGGQIGDFQFSEQEEHGETVLVVRVAPGVPGSDGEVLAAVSAHLRAHEMGALAMGLWEPARSIRVERSAPVPALSGKVLPFEPLR